MMESLAHLHDDHKALDAQISRLEELLGKPTHTSQTAVVPLLAHLSDRLLRHIQFEEIHFYAPLKASGHARPALMTILESEHEDLLETLEYLQQLQQRALPADDVELTTYAFHLIELYREHTDREHRWLFPLLEQLPPPTKAETRVISKDMTLNAMMRCFPRLRTVLHALGLDYRWYGSHTLEEAAWYHGMQIEEVLGALNQSIAIRGDR